MTQSQSTGSAKWHRGSPQQNGFRRWGNSAWIWIKPVLFHERTSKAKASEGTPNTTSRRSARSSSSWVIMLCSGTEGYVVWDQDCFGVVIKAINFQGRRSPCQNLQFASRETSHFSPEQIKKQAGCTEKAPLCQPGLPLAELWRHSYKACQQPNLSCGCKLLVIIKAACVT